ncbi:GTP cyclohydrolase 1 type 2/Nif3 [Phellopilus nigrolimitatus]|nr:GTP cyclohydrolase 1 type 2/Nif3 [Phellopilus nigrolimitatus]
MSFVKSVCAAMQRIAPLRLAESWDNVGLLLEAPVPNPGKKILLTIDLTPAVAHEAIAARAGVLIAYHPPVFRALRALTLGDPLQASLLRLAHAGVSVYAPHTALDAVAGGVNDWLARAFGPGGAVRCLQEKEEEPGAGAGRLLTLPGPGLPIADVVARVKRHLGLTGQVQLATPYTGDRNVQTVAICAGSGGSMLAGVDADLYFTGEMSHHEVLAARAMNRYVLLCGHTNTERGYLPVLKAKLLDAQGEDPELSGMDVQVSEADKHPLVGL